MELVYNDVNIEEFYAKIPGCSSYLISNKGKIYSLFTNKVIKPNKLGNGYLRIEIKDDNGNYVRKLIHRLVITTFGDKNGNRAINPGYDIDHINRNKNDNSIDNLEIVSHQVNIHRLHRFAREGAKNNGKN